MEAGRWPRVAAIVDTIPGKPAHVESLSDYPLPHFAIRDVTQMAAVGVTEAVDKKAAGLAGSPSLEAQRLNGSCP